MLLMVLKKMLNRIWMSVCLLTGSILVAALVSSIPIYTDGVLQRMLTRDLEIFQVNSGIFPGTYKIRLNLNYTGDNKFETINYFNSRITGSMADKIGLYSRVKVINLTMDYLKMIPEGVCERNQEKTFPKIDSLSGLEEHISILHGRKFSPSMQDEICEIMVTKKAMINLGLIMNKVYDISFITGKSQDTTFKVKIVGVFTYKDPIDLYWFQGLESYNNSLFMDYELFRKVFLKGKHSPITSAVWFYGFDYHGITIKNMSKIIDTYENQERWLNQYRGAIDFRMPAISIMKKYREREKKLTITLWVLLVPVFIMFSFYIYMISKLIINSEQSEIAVIKSRGGSLVQILYAYLAESIILSFFALLIGPPCGLILCRIIGASNGFMEFVQRPALNVAINLKAYLYTVISLVFLIITMLLPVLSVTRKTIVTQKQRKNKSIPIWRKYLLDIIALGVSSYGLYRYNNQQKILNITGIKGTDVGIDPLLFITSSLFILGAGMMFLRLFPYIIRFIFKLGERTWSPAIYATFIQVGMYKGQQQFLMLFIVLSLSVGIYNANTARTINKNIEDKIRYEIGTDVVITPYWQSISPLDYRELAHMTLGGIESGVETELGEENLIYIEPPFEPYLNLTGVESATKVYRQVKAVADVNGQSVVDVTVMGIMPNEFGRTAWFRADLMQYHWFNYLNLLVDAPKAFLVSRSFQDKYKAEEGDFISVRWGNQDYLVGTIYAFIDYWPAINPKSENDPAFFIVGNLSYIHNSLAIEPYEVWLKKENNIQDGQINESIKNASIEINDIKYAGQKIISKKNDPMLQGTNGLLTLGFIVAMLICCIGFLIYWVLSIQNRILQFGIFRAMGLSRNRVTGMILWEQIFVSATSVFIGILLGGITSDLFIPLLQIVYSTAGQVPPFKVAFYASDYFKIYILTVVMFTLSYLLLKRFISRMRIDQALKLGED